MTKVKLMAFGCGTLAVALIVGHFIQNNTAPLAANTLPPAPPVEDTPLDADLANAAAALKVEEIATVVAEDSEIEPLELNAITLTSALPAPPDAVLDVAALPTQPITLAAAVDEPITEMPTEEPTPAFGCDYTLSAEPSAGAMVSLSLDVPCMPNERFTLHHNGMMFTEITDDNGRNDMLVPALSAEATFIASFANGEGAIANIAVTSFDYYDRVAVQWEGDAGLQVHALEFGADFGDDGHVWADAPHDLSDAVDGSGGFLTRLGAADQEKAYQVEVYTFPSSLAARGGDVRLQVEAQVTQANCARDIEAQSLQVGPGSRIKVQELTLAMPECNAVGDFLVLKNLLNDLKIAQN